jgi:hypothetical protein
MKSDLFKKADFNKVRKGDTLFLLEDQIVQLVIKKTRKLVKLENLHNSEVTWMTRLRFHQRGYYYLEK